MQLQAQLAAAEAKVRASIGPRGGQPPGPVVTAMRDALTALIRAEEICKILNSMDLEAVPGL